MSTVSLKLLCGCLQLKQLLKFMPESRDVCKKMNECSIIRNEFSKACLRKCKCVRRMKMWYIHETCWSCFVTNEMPYNEGNLKFNWGEPRPNDICRVTPCSICMVQSNTKVNKMKRCAVKKDNLCKFMGIRELVRHSFKFYKIKVENLW